MTEQYGEHYSVMYNECLDTQKEAATDEKAVFADR